MSKDEENEKLRFLSSIKLPSSSLHRFLFSVKTCKQEGFLERIEGKEYPMTQVPLLRQEYAFQCPRCKRHNLVRSDDLNVYFLCPDEACSYVIWAVPPVQASLEEENE